MTPKNLRYIACLLALVLVTGLCAGCAQLMFPTPTASRASQTTLQATVTTQNSTTTAPQPSTPPETAPTTQPSTTVPVVTVPPTTVPPTTIPPTTVPPTTAPPTTAPPTTAPPTTAPPTTAPPTTAPPTTAPPTTAPPTTEPPTTAPETPPTDPTLPPVEVPVISAEYAFVLDLRSEEYLFTNCEIDTSLYPASVTKLFTTYVALQYLDPDDSITVGNELNYLGYNASVAGFQKGDCVTVETLVYGALLPSGCDASYILAAAAGRNILGNQDATAKNAINAFLDTCNQEARKLGMENTSITSPDGYHRADHYISVQAIGIIGRCALENKLISKVAATKSYTATYTNAQNKTCTKKFLNTNETIQSDNKYYHKMSVGLKTGTTSEAGACLLAAYQVEDGYILVGVFGCKTSNARFADANALFDAYYPYL